MDKKARRRRKKFILKVTEAFMDMLDELADDVESGNMTPEQLVVDIRAAKQQFKHLMDEMS